MKQVKKGYRKSRVVRPIEKNRVKGYDSNWEYELHTGILDNWSFHTDKVPYVVEHKYEPDFVKIIDGKTILLEAKGRFWDYAEYSKYIHIREALPKDYELIFLFQKPFAPMPASKKRKDGTKRSHAEWAETNNFTWYNEESVPKEWRSSEL